MSLYGFYWNKQVADLKWRYSRKRLYCADLDRAIAKQRLLKLFRPSKLDQIIDEVC